MPFTTTRLIVRKLKKEDLSCFYKLQSSIAVMRYVGRQTMTFEESKKDLGHIINCYTKPDNDFWIWGVLLKQEHTCIGTCALVKNKKGEHEIGFRFLEEFWGKGYAKELVRALINYGFDHLQLPEIVAYVDADNKASVKTLERYFTFISSFENLEEQCTDRYYRLQNPKFP